MYGRKYAYENGLLVHAKDIAKQSLDFFELDYFEISSAVPPKIGKKRRLNMFFE